MADLAIYKNIYLAKTIKNGRFGESKKSTPQQLPTPLLGHKLGFHLFEQAGFDHLNSK
jgi:hypothetical protein